MLLQSDIDVNTLAVGEYAVAVRLMFVAAMLLVPIVLLNLLIALMSDSYERIQDRAEVDVSSRCCALGSCMRWSYF